MMALPSPLKPRHARPWAPRAEIAPRTHKTSDGMLVAVSNGSDGCYGGWDLVYPTPRSDYVRFSVGVRWNGLARGFDCVHVVAYWEGSREYCLDWAPVLPVKVGKSEVSYEATIPVSKTADRLILRLCLAWSATGEVCFRAPTLTDAPAPRPRRWRLGAAGGFPTTGKRTLKSNSEFYLGLCGQAASAGVDLLCLPEVMLQCGLPCDETTLSAMAIELPGKEIESFQEFARKHKMALCFSAFERDRELVHNTAILLDRRGELIGKYRKVHLAPPLEIWWGTSPGHDFPVYDLHGAKVAMNICMDSSALESARVPARRGAEILCMPIMGDHRAVASSVKLPEYDFDLDRWCAIQRVRAMDNQLYMLISRNSGFGTGIFAPDGNILALSCGRQLVTADVDLSQPPRTVYGATYRGVCWFERREPTYGPLVGQDVEDPFTNKERQV